MPTRITHLDHKARGITEEGQVVPRTLPGELIAVEDPLRILTPVADRVRPACRHFNRCGGCALQHASDDFVAQWKRDQVSGAVRKAGVDATVLGPVTSPAQSRRRAALKGRKTKKGAHVGFHAAGLHDLVPIPDCKLLHPSIVAAFPALERLTRLGAPRGAEIQLHLTVTNTGLDLLVLEAKPIRSSELGSFAQEFARITWNGEPMLMATRPELDLGMAKVSPPPGAFLQATSEGEAALCGALGPAFSEASRVADLFSGLGTFTFPAARHAPVDAFEGDAQLVEALEKGARHSQGLKAIRAHRRDLFREPLSPDDLMPYDTVIIDPPRAGAQAQVAQLARSRVKRIAYVSCNPGTFARDAATLIAAEYQIGPIQVVDQFRWSPHIEVVAIFELP